MNDDVRVVSPLSIEADLTVSVDGRDLAVESEGDRLVVTVPSLRVARRLLSSYRALPLEGRLLDRELDRADLTIEVRYGGAVVATAGAGRPSNALGRLLGVEPASVRLGGVLRGLFGRGED